MTTSIRFQRSDVRLPRAWIFALGACVVLAGCGKDSPPTQPPATGAAPVAGNAPHSTSPTPPSSTATASRDERTRWIGDVPYDVFYDRPLEVYRQAGPAVANEPVEPGPTVPTVEPVPTPTEPAAEPTVASVPAANGDQAAVDWGAVAPMQLLEAETKEIRTRLSANLQTVATYNANTDGIETDGSVLALIAAIIERHPQELNWKDRSRFVRQLAYDIYLNASGKGRGPFQKTKEPFEKIVSILDGGPAPDTEAAELAPLGEIGDRAQVMLRIESGFDWLRADINTPTRMKEDKDRVIRETTVLASLATALADASFDSADQEAYVTLLRQFITGQQAMGGAAERDDFAAFEQARDSVQKSCDACHLEYRNSSPDE